MANVINLDKLFDQTTPIQLRVNKTNIQIGREKEEFTLSLAQWLRMNGVQKYETNLEKDGIHSLADLYKNQALMKTAGLQTCMPPLWGRQLSKLSVVVFLKHCQKHIELRDTFFLFHADLICTCASFSVEMQLQNQLKLS